MDCLLISRGGVVGPYAYLSETSEIMKHLKTNRSKSMLNFDYY